MDSPLWDPGVSSAGAPHPTHPIAPHKNWTLKARASRLDLPEMTVSTHDRPTSEVLLGRTQAQNSLTERTAPSDAGCASPGRPATAGSPFVAVAEVFPGVRLAPSRRSVYPGER